ncbi:MAG TPA: hypothetical protein VFP11_09870, partial [Candidatus Angelobacter sp.]|nr:hypothetical protein [Candidatus Angelobacter sp.]
MREGIVARMNLMQIMFIAPRQCVSGETAHKMMQQRAGSGCEALAITFRFDEYGSDPYATHLLDG